MAPRAAAMPTLQPRTQPIKTPDMRVATARDLGAAWWASDPHNDCQGNRERAVPSPPWRLAHHQRYYRRICPHYGAIKKFHGVSDRTSGVRPKGYLSWDSRRPTWRATPR